MTTKTKTLSATSLTPMQQADVEAIETAFQKFSVARKNNDIMSGLEAINVATQTGELDQAAVAYVAAKHGYTPSGQKLPRTKADPAWENFQADLAG